MPAATGCTTCSRVRFLSVMTPRFMISYKSISSTGWKPWALFEKQRKVSVWLIAYNQPLLRWDDFSATPSIDSCTYVSCSRIKVSKRQIFFTMQGALFCRTDRCLKMRHYSYILQPWFLLQRWAQCGKITSTISQGGLLDYQKWTATGRLHFKRLRVIQTQSRL